MNIRIATTQDGDGIRRLYWSAFPEGEKEITATPGQDHERFLTEHSTF